VKHEAAIAGLASEGLARIWAALERAAIQKVTFAVENGAQREIATVRSFVLTLFIFKAPNYVLARTLTERVV